MKILNFWPTYTAAAIALCVSREAVRKWVRDGVPAERVINVCQATDWQVTPHALRPDLYPNVCDAMPAGSSYASNQATAPTENREAA